MTANLFEQFETPAFNWRLQEVTIPSLDEWEGDGGLPEAHVIRASALKSAQRFVADVMKELLPREQDELYRAIFTDGIEGRAEGTKNNKYCAIVTRFIKRHDNGRYNDLVRDYIAQIAGY